MKSQLSLLIVLLTIHSSSFTQSDWINYSEEDGLASNEVLTMDFDANGNIWVGMGSGTFGDGLDTFDGDEWIHYDTSNSEIPSQALKKIEFDQDNTLWMNFFGGTVLSVQKLTKFDGQEWYAFDTSNTNILSNDIYDFDIDNSNVVWACCEQGFSRIEEDTIINYYIDDLVPQSIFAEDSTSVWFGFYTEEIGYGLGHFNPTTDNLIETFHDGNSDIPGTPVKGMARDSTGKLWLTVLQYNGGLGTGANGGIATYDGQEFVGIHPFGSQYTSAYDVEIGQNGFVYIPTRCEGLYIFNGEYWLNIDGPPLDGCSWEVTLDDQDNVWFGEVYSGIWTNSEPLSVPELARPSLTVYPIPASDKVMIELDNRAIEEVVLYNSQGMRLMRRDGHTESLNISSLESGVYFLKVITPKGVFSKPIIKN